MKAVLCAGFPEACLSHDTALDAYGVSDINPTAIHITVAKKGVSLAKTAKATWRTSKT
jgi:predicted transcriptional regulator of viral defense system